MAWTASVSPQPGPAETHSVDGYTERGGASEAFSSICTLGANISSDTGNTHLFKIQCTAGPADTWQGCGRFHMLFHPDDLDIALPTGAIISAIRLKIYSAVKHDDFGTDSVVLTATNPVTDTTINTLAHVTVSATKLSDELAMAAISDSTWFTLTLNAAGIAAVQTAFDGSACAKLCLRYVADVDQVAPAWGAGDYEQLPLSSADSANDPVLELDFRIGPGYATVKVTAQKTNAGDVVTADTFTLDVFK